MLRVTIALVLCMTSAVTTTGSCVMMPVVTNRIGTPLQE
jgi:hypothetical protein